MKSSIKGVYITERDINLFRYLHSVKVATYDQIQRDIYTSYKLDSVGIRLRKLENNKLITGYRKRTLRNGKRIVFLTKKGFDMFVKRGDEQRIELKSDSVEHDLQLVDIRYLMKKQKKTYRYLTENELQTWGHFLFDSKYSTFVNLNSDAIAELKAPRGLVNAPIEYDAFHKSTTRYEKVLNQYYSHDSTQIVLYFCKSHSSLKQLQKLEQLKFGTGKLKFFYILIEDFLKNEQLTLTNCNGDKLRL